MAILSLYVYILEIKGEYMTENNSTSPVTQPSLWGLTTAGFRWCLALGVVLLGIAWWGSTTLHAITVRDGENTAVYYTRHTETTEILREKKIATLPQDRIVMTALSGGREEIRIDRSFPVTITVDGAVYGRMLPPMTVGECIEAAGISLGEQDEISHDKDSMLTEATDIQIYRVTLEESVRYEPVPFEVEYKENGLIYNGRTRTLVDGEEGVRTLTYVDRVVDGVVQARELSGSFISTPPTNAVVLRGDNGVPVSSLDWGVALDANGNPTQYKAVLKNQIVTAYSAFSGAKGASRMTLVDGSVAVRADQIPYGTKMYIKSPDNRFVYGCAIAADTGIGLMQHVIDIDVFYETYVESCLHGRKYLDVYIL